MGFITVATVKSDPYKKGVKKKQCVFRLWSDTFWRQLVKAAEHDPSCKECFRMIGDMNKTLYGKR